MATKRKLRSEETDDADSSDSVHEAKRIKLMHVSRVSRSVPSNLFFFFFFWGGGGGQAFSQRGVRVSFGHPIADFEHPNIHIFVYNAMGWKGIGHPIHHKCVFSLFWTPNSEILAKTRGGGGGDNLSFI